ncbi:MAG: asparaginase [Planctomycetaceae bacterium]|nr:asparaginase [Planctomycetaceae bacterium]
MTRNDSINSASLPLISVLATGGTIAGQSTRQGSSANYRSGVVSGDDLLAAVPGLSAAVRLRAHQVANIGSEDMTSDVWLDLVRTASQELDDPEVSGVIVLHGTDTMEETAVFLDCLLPHGKPVVMTGAMRPADAVSADGPANILAAVQTAVCPAASGRGVLVVFNNDIHAARRVRKTDSMALNAFSSWGGPEGRVVDGDPVFFRPATAREGLPVFTVAGLDALPRVEIIYGHAGQERGLVDAALAAGAWGLVHAGVGMGNVHGDVRPALAEAVAGGVAVVCATRVVDGPVPLTEKIRRDGFIAAGFLSPAKARVLLQVALTRGDWQKGGMQALFDRYSLA